MLQQHHPIGLGEPVDTGKAFDKVHHLTGGPVRELANISEGIADSGAHVVREVLLHLSTAKRHKLRFNILKNRRENSQLEKLAARFFFRFSNPEINSHYEK